MKTPKGFIALISAIIISMILSAVATEASLSGFYGRDGALYGEEKAQSEAAALGCEREAVLHVSENTAFTGPVALSLNANEQCQGNVVDSSSQKSIRIQATSSDAVTDLQIFYDPATHAVVSWEEVPMY